MTDRYKPLDDDPAKWAMGPLQFVERSMAIPGAEGQVRMIRILQTYVWRFFTAEYCQEHAPNPEDQKGECVWMDVPLREEE